MITKQSWIKSIYIHIIIYIIPIAISFIKYSNRVNNMPNERAKITIVSRDQILNSDTKKRLSKIKINPESDNLANEIEPTVKIESINIKNGNINKLQKQSESKLSTKKATPALAPPPIAKPDSNIPKQNSKAKKPEVKSENQDAMIEDIIKDLDKKQESNNTENSLSGSEVNENKTSESDSISEAKIKDFSDLERGNSDNLIVLSSIDPSSETELEATDLQEGVFNISDENNANEDKYQHISHALFEETDEEAIEFVEIDPVSIIKLQIERAWSFKLQRNNINKHNAVISATANFSKDGLLSSIKDITIISSSDLLSKDDIQVMINTAKEAIIDNSPLIGFSEEKYQDWKSLTIQFHSKKVK